jgi:proteasome lid subunit RPN8/RPN11
VPDAMTAAKHAPGPDVRQLRAEGLPQERFPGGRDQDFRVFFTPEVHRAIWNHATEETAVEICGVLVGLWQRDEDGPFVAVSGSIRGEAAESKFAEVTFTHQTWAKINAEMDREFADRSIVGWYHTHPDFGIFLSDRDRFIQEHFFSGSGQIAHVIDPVRKTEGVFGWRNARPELIPYVWVGRELKLSPNGVDSGRSLPAQPAAPTAAAPLAATDPRDRLLTPLERALAFLTLFLLGYLFASWKSSWERDRLAEGVVAHYGIWEGLKPGLDQALDRLGADLRGVAPIVDALSNDHLSKLDKDKPADAQKDAWRALRNRLAEDAELVSRMKAVYAPSEAESAAIRKLIEQRIRALSPEPEPSPAPTPEAGTSKPNPAPPAPTDTAPPDRPKS